jgi:hypothetical protein
MLPTFPAKFILPPQGPNRPLQAPTLGFLTAICQIITNHITHSLCSKFASHLLPYNFAVGIEDSMNFVIKAFQL